jgi:porphobilinogen synthase
MELQRRPRRNRFSPARRELIRETRFSPSQLIAPLFIVPGEKRKDPLSSLPGVFAFSPDMAVIECEELLNLGIGGVDLFPILSAHEKDPRGSKALDRFSPLAKATEEIKKNLPELTLMVDLALDPYTNHGHDGLLDPRGFVLNDETVEKLTEMAILYAELGVDYVAPSDMMDGRVGAIRRALDQQGHLNVGILAYTAKYASALYGPFRNTLDSAVKNGDKKGYHMDFCNAKEALLEAYLDEQEGADLLLVKPALPYLDIIYRIQEKTPLPVGAYHVSGEYAMLKAAAEKGYLVYEKALLETLTAIFRAGASFCLTYAAKEAAKLL